MSRPTTRRSHVPLAALGALTLLLTAACSGDDDGDDGNAAEAADDTDAQAYIDAAATSLTGDPELGIDPYLDAVVACPAVVTAAFLAEAPGTVTPEAQACVSALVEANPDLVRAAFGGDTAGAEELGAEIAATCPEAVGG